MPVGRERKGPMFFVCCTSVYSTGSEALEEWPRVRRNHKIVSIAEQCIHNVHDSLDLPRQDSSLNSLLEDNVLEQ